MIDQVQNSILKEMADRVVLPDGESPNPVIPLEDTLLVKSSELNGKEYLPLAVGTGLTITTDGSGNKTISGLPQEYLDLLEALSHWVQLFPLPVVGRRLMSPIGSPFTQGKIYT